MIKRLLLPITFLGLLFTLVSPASAQITCAISSSGSAIGAVPALPGVTINASDIGLTEVGASGTNGIADLPGGGRVRITCTNANPSGGASSPINPGVSVLTVSFGAPITNSQTHPSTAAGIRLINGTGDFVTPGPSSPTTPNPGNVGIASIDNAGGKVIIGLGTAGATAGGAGTAPVVPATGITFSAGATSSFELAGWLLATSGKTGPISATLTASSSVQVATGGGTCPASGGVCTQVITNVKPSLQDPTLPGGALPALVTALPNLGTTPISSGPAVVNSSGVALKSNFTIRVQENYPDFFKSAAQFDTGAVFPNSAASTVQVNVAFSNVPAGLQIAGCSAVLTDITGAAPAVPGGASLSTNSITPASTILTVVFTSPVDQANIDVLWITCTKVGLGSATLPLPSTPVTAQVFAGPTGTALSATGAAQTGLTTGLIPRFAPPAAATNPLIISFGSAITVSPSTPPATIAAIAGTSQTVEVGSALNSLRVTVKDRFDNLVSGATVSFTSDATTNAGVIFPRGNTVVTDDSGQAAIDARANFNIGNYNVTASSGTASVATFNLTNTQRRTVAVPALGSGNASQLGVAWTNTSNRSITLRATARSYDGQLIAGNGIQNPADLTIPAGGQIARLGVEIFGAGVAGRAGWMELTASDAGVDGFFQLFDGALSNSDGAPFPVAPAARLVFPHVDKDTILHVVNTGDNSISSTAVLLYDNNGALSNRAALSLGAKAGWSGHIADLLPSSQSFDGYVVVDTLSGAFATPSETLVGMQSHQGGDAAIVLAQRDSETVQTGYAVHVVTGGGYTSRLTLVNAASIQQQLQLTLNGTTVQRTIPAFGRLDESLADMFNLSSANISTGYLKVEAPSNAPGVSGFVEIAVAGGLMRTTTPVAGEAQTRLVFSDIAQGGGYFTGLALLNAGATASVTIEVDSADGTTLASKTVTLGTNQRLVGLINELFPTLQNQMGGFVRVTSTTPIYGLQIIGITDQRLGSFLTNIPGEAF